jgi:hypothetical protein
MTDIVVRLRDPSKGSPRWLDTMAEAADEIVALREAMDDLEQEMRHLENLVQAAKDDGWSGGYSG